MTNALLSSGKIGLDMAIGQTTLDTIVREAHPVYTNTLLYQNLERAFFIHAYGSRVGCTICLYAILHLSFFQVKKCRTVLFDTGVGCAFEFLMEHVQEI